MPILQRKTETQRAVLQGRRPWKTLKRTLPSTPPNVSNSFPPLSFFCLSNSSRVSDHMDMGPSELVGRSCYQFVHGQDATRIRQSHLDRETHFCTLSPPTTKTRMALVPWKSFFRANHGTAAPGAVWNRKASKSLSKGSWGWAVSGVRGVSGRCWDTSRSLTFSVPFSVFLDFPHSCCLCLSPAHLP